jgi:hypothetical protein
MVDCADTRSKKALQRGSHARDSRPDCEGGGEYAHDSDMMLIEPIKNMGRDARPCRETVRTGEAAE